MYILCVRIPYNCTVHGADLTNISLLVILCIIVYVTNKILNLEIRSTLLKGVLLISVCYLYKRQPVHRSNQSNRFQTLHHGQDQRAVQGCQGQDCRPTQGWNGLQDHRQAAWWEGDNSWCDYSQMEETQNNCQSPSVWVSMQALSSWSFNDHENGEESAQNYTGGSCQVKTSHLYLYSAFNNTNCVKATAQYQNRKIVCQ